MSTNVYVCVSIKLYLQKQIFVECCYTICLGQVSVSWKTDVNLVLSDDRLYWIDTPKAPGRSKHKAVLKGQLVSQAVRASCEEDKHRFLNTTQTRKQLTTTESQHLQRLQGLSFLRPPANTELLLNRGYVTQAAKNPSSVQEIQVVSLNWEDTLEKAMATNPLQYSCLENSKTEEPGTTFHGVAKSQTQQSN